MELEDHEEEIIELQDDDTFLDSEDHTFTKPPSVHDLRKSNSAASLGSIPIPDAEEYEKEVEELQKHSLRGAELRASRSESTNQLETVEDTVLKSLPPNEHEYLGLVKEVPLEKTENEQGKVRRRPSPVDFDLAEEIIRIPREHIIFFGEGSFPEDFPPELDGLVTEDEYMQSIGNINEVISGVPTMRSGLVFIPPLILSSLVLLYMVLFYKNPPFYPLMVVFGFWCLCAFGVVIGFAVYYAFQREVQTAIAKEDVRLFHRGVRLATKLHDRKASQEKIEKTK